MLLLCLILNLRDLYSEICASVKLSQSKPLAFEEGGIGDFKTPPRYTCMCAIFSRDILKWNINSTQKYPLPKLFLIELVNQPYIFRDNFDFAKDNSLRLATVRPKSTIWQMICEKNSAKHKKSILGNWIQQLAQTCSHLKKNDLFPLGLYCLNLFKYTLLFLWLLYFLCLL